MFHLFLKYLLAITFFMSTTDGFDYCTVNCGDIKHTMCEYPAGGGPECTDYKNDFSSAEKEAVLNTHNYLRWQVAIGNVSGQPGASNMLKLEWSDDAATTAQRWNEQCTKKGHDNCRNSQTGVYEGQNIASAQMPVPRDRMSVLYDFVYNLFSEYKDLNPADVDKFNPVYSDNMTGHYTQLVWALTSSVGCGFSVNLLPAIKKYKMTCNYLPGGNMMTVPMYKRGKACSKCPQGTKCSKKYPGLCTAEKSDFGDGKIPELTAGWKQSKGHASTSSSTLFHLVIIIIANFYNVYLSS